jgi:hypothetical protein
MRLVIGSGSQRRMEFFKARCFGNENILVQIMSFPISCVSIDFFKVKAEMKESHSKRM